MKEETTMDDVQKLIDDEADKYGFVVPYDGSNKFYNDDKVNGFLAGAKFGQQITSAPLLAKIEELEKELVHHNTTINNLQNDLMERVNQITALQSSLKEKEGEVSILHGFRDYLLEDQKVKFDRISELEEGLRLVVDQFNPDASDEKDVVDNPDKYEPQDVRQARTILSVYKSVHNLAKQLLK